MIPVEVMVDDVNDGVATFSGTTSHLSLLNGAKVKATASNIGNKVTVFITDDGKSVVSSSVAKAGSAADKTFTNGPKLIDIVVKNDDKDRKANYVADAVGADHTESNFKGDMKVYKDGVEITDSVNLESEAIKSGDKVEVFLTDGKVSMIKITKYDVDTVTGATETRVYKEKDQVKVPGPVGAFTDVDKVDGWQGLAEDDVVLTNTSKGVTYLTKADKITGKVTRRNAAKLTINGTQYSASGLVDDLGFDSWDVSGNKDNEYDFFLDLNGDVCAYKQVSGEVTTETAYVLDAAYKNTGTNNGLDGGDKYQQAKLLFTDGTTQIVRVNKLYDGEQKKMVKVEEDKSSDLNGKMIEFSVDSKGYYEITVKESASVTKGDEGYAIAQKPDVTTGLKADKKTVFMVEKVNDDDSEFFVYTSYENVPKMTADKLVAVTKDGYATYVYLQTTKFDGDGSDGLVYLKDANNDEEDTDGHKIYEMVDAEGREVSMAVEFAEGSTAKSKKFYLITSTDENDVVTLKEATKDTDYVEAETVTVGNGVVTVAENAYSTSDTVCVLIDEDSEGFVSAANISVSKVDTAEEDYTFKVLLIKDGDAADYLYVVRSPKASTATPAE
ncbi:MAG: hypothetical protein NC311_15455 [Muribaculaceae bacterium]|nr:hypothetical protein [Muribaculaceae bacterium]